MKRNGFSLVELSISLVIIGLLTAGAVGIGALVEQARLRSITTGIEKMKTALNTFTATNGALPGDMAAAHAIWGNKCATIAAECNGDGNGQIETTASLQDNEGHRAFQHLTLAGAYEGSFSGISTVATNQSDIGINVPAVYDGSVGLYIHHGTFNGLYSSPLHYLGIGGFRATTINTSAWIDSQSAQLLDVKIDDGISDTGNFIAGQGIGATGNCLVGGVNQGAPYLLSDTTRSCWVGYKLSELD